MKLKIAVILGALVIVGTAFLIWHGHRTTIAEVVSTVKQGWTEGMVQRRFPDMLMRQSHVDTEDATSPMIDTLIVKEHEDTLMVRCFQNVVDGIVIYSADPTTGTDHIITIWQAGLDSPLSTYLWEHPTRQSIAEDKRLAQQTQAEQQQEEQKRQQISANLQAEERAKQQQEDALKAANQVEKQKKIAELTAQINALQPRLNEAKRVFIEANMATGSTTDPDQKQELGRRASELQQRYFDLQNQKRELENQREWLGGPAAPINDF